MRFVERHDIIVVGSGMAGLCAALTGLEAGLDVLIVEREACVGGTTFLSDGVFNCFDPKRQIKSRVEDSPEKHLKDVLAAGRLRNHVKLAETFCYEALPTLSWLENLGFEFESKIYRVKGAPYPRCHRPSKGRGDAYVTFLLQEAQKRGLKLMLKTTVMQPLWDGRRDRIAGVVVSSRDPKRTEMAIGARIGVVFAYGGFQANNELLARYSPLLDGAGSYGAPGCRGELLAKAADLGGETIHTGYFVWHLEADCPSCLMHPERFILVDAKGQRFCREDLQFDALGERILECEGKTAWLASSDIHSSASVPFKNEDFRKTLEDYNRSVAFRHDAAFGKDPHFLQPLTGRLGFMRVTPRVATTLGGLLINEGAQVLDRHGRPIEGLAAAGDAVGGIFGCWSATGDNLAAAAVFGRLAVRTLLERKGRSLT